MEVKVYITIDEVAELFQVNPETVRRWSISGKIPAAKIGDVWRYRRSDLESFFDSQKNGVKDDR